MEIFGILEVLKHVSDLLVMDLAAGDGHERFLKYWIWPVTKMIRNNRKTQIIEVKNPCIGNTGHGLFLYALLIQPKLYHAVGMLLVGQGPGRWQCCLVLCCSLWRQAEGSISLSSIVFKSYINHKISQFLPATLIFILNCFNLVCWTVSLGMITTCWI